jgi:hypothetical protein
MRRRRLTLKVDVLLATDGLRVRFPARTWELAHDTIEDLKENPPEGYRMVESQVKPRGNRKPGRRCNVNLTFDHYDNRVPRLPTSGAKVYFEPYALDAQGVEP